MTPQKQPERYNSLDKLRTLAAFMVVLVHTVWPGRFEKYILGIVIICVPLFFLISGFFFHAPSLKKQLKKLLGLLVRASALFLALLCLNAYRQGDLASFIQSTFSIRNLGMFLVFNQGMPNTHLWYLRAILYVLIIVYYADRHGKKDLLYRLAPLLLCGNLILGKYSRLLFGAEFEVPIARNWLFIGLPFYAAGMWIRENIENIRSRLQHNGRRRLILFAAVFMFTLIIEIYLLEQFGLNTTINYTISAAPLSVAVFLYFLFYVDQNDNLLSYIGRRYSTGIYIFHPVFVTVIPLLFNGVNSMKFYTYLKPVIVFVLTLAAVGIPELVKRKLS